MKHRNLVLKLLKEWQANIKSKIEFDINEFSNECGTTMCIAGYLSIKPEIRDLGFYSHRGQGFVIKYEHFFDMDAVEQFFDLSYSEAQNLFDSSGYVGLSHPLTLKDVIDKIELLDETL